MSADIAQPPGDGSVPMFVHAPSRVDATYGVINNVSGHASQVNNNFQGNGAVVNQCIHLHHSPARDHQEFEEWLSPLNFRQTQADNHDKHNDGTGDWVFETEEFKKWMAGMPKNLWGRGIPGAGKTVLASHIIRYLQRTRESESVAVFFVYCNYKEHAAQTVYNLIGSILKQLVQHSPASFQRVEHQFRTHRQQRFKPTLNEICDTLVQEINHFSQVFIVADGLDEILEENDRSNLLHKLQSLGANLLVTSRDIESIGESFPDAQHMDIRAPSDDLRKCVDDYIRPGTTLHRLIGGDLSFRDEIVTGILDKAADMFLLCHLHVVFLGTQRTRQEIRTALRALPKELDQAYHATMQRIWGLSEKDRNIALWAITWIANARRSLRTTELQYLVAFSLSRFEVDGQNLVEVDDEILTQFNDDNVVDVSFMIDFCFGLITCDRNESVFKLVHYTVQQYWTTNPEQLFPNPHELLTRLCLQILSSPSTSVGSFNRDLLLYPARNWGKHARGPVEESLRIEIRDYLACQRNVQTNLKHIQYVLDNVEYQSGGSALHLCALFGLAQTIRYRQCDGAANGLRRIWRDIAFHASSFFGSARYLQHTAPTANIIQSDWKDEPLYVQDDGKIVVVNPLFLAAVTGSIEVMNVLLERDDVDVDHKYMNGMTSLLYAAIGGNLEVAKLLLARNADINSRDFRDATPLILAIAVAGIDIVKLLLETRGVNVNLADEGGWSPLHYAVWKGQTEVIQLLLARDDIEVNSTTKRGSTPLSSAACLGRVDIAKLLLERHDTDPNLPDEDGCSPLHHAAAEGYVEVVELLLARDDIHVNSTNDRGFTPLHHTVEAEPEEAAVVQLLLARSDVDVNSIDKRGWTPLSAAAELGNMDIFELFLERDADLCWRHESGATLLHLAVKNGHERLVELLLTESNIDVNQQDEYGNSALHLALHYEHGEAVRLLLQHDNIALDVKNVNGETPLHCAIQTVTGDDEDTQLENVRLLLAHDVCVDIQDNDGLAPLELARSFDAIAIADLLEQHLANTPLCSLEGVPRRIEWLNRRASGMCLNTSDTASDVYGNKGSLLTDSSSEAYESAVEEM